MDDVRNMLLTELIDKMHSRLADKMFPPDPSKDDQPAVAVEAVDPEAAKEEKSVDIDKDAEEPTDDELDELLK